MKLVRSLAFTLVSTVFIAAKPPADVQARLDAYVKDQPGGIAVAWVDADGEKFFSAGKFAADDPRVIDPDTQFEIASASKVFTALLLAESERAGKVSRSDPVGKYLLPPGDPAQETLAKITLLSLTTHTSGLPKLPSDFPFQRGLASGDPYVGLTRKDLVDSLRKDGPAAKSGGDVMYSNFGVALLGEALASAWGTSYNEALQAHVLKPLGMDHTTVALAGSKPAGELAPGHTAGKRVPNWYHDAYAPMGGLRSSARDMAKFLRAALGPDEAPLHAAFEATTQPQHHESAFGGSVCLGWFVTPDSKQPIFWHNGQSGGYHSFVGFTRTGGGAGVVVLTNRAENIDELGFRLLGRAPKEVASLKEIALPAETLAEYAGRYPITPKFVLTVTVDGGVVGVQATGQGKNPVYPSAKDEFFLKGVNAQISFTRDAAGKVNGLVLHQNGHDQRAKRAE